MLAPNAIALTVFLLPFAAQALPFLGFGQATSTQSTSQVSNDTIDSALVQPAQFSRIAYCTPPAVLSWKCGPPCQATPGVKVLAAGGTGGEIPFYYIAHEPTSNSIVLAHQGTEASNILSIVNDAEFGLVNINSTRFPNTSGVQVHDGFQKTFERTADGVLSGVKSALSSTGATNVLVTGHSLGAAISTMDALMLKINLPSNIKMTTTVFGLPRGGNQAFADMIDSMLGSSFSFVTNQHDPVPTVPPRFLDFQHSQGEIHIQSSNPATGNATSVVSCPGQENDQCIDSNSIVDATIANHIGPYFANISMSHKNCPL
jgi:hypothetical protein